MDTKLEPPLYLTHYNFEFNTNDKTKVYNILLYRAKDSSFILGYDSIKNQVVGQIRPDSRKKIHDLRPRWLSGEKKDNIQGQVNVGDVNYDRDYIVKIDPCFMVHGSYYGFVPLCMPSGQVATQLPPLQPPVCDINSDVIVTKIFDKLKPLFDRLATPTDIDIYNRLQALQTDNNTLRIINEKLKMDNDKLQEDNREIVKLKATIKELTNKIDKLEKQPVKEPTPDKQRKKTPVDNVREPELPTDIVDVDDVQPEIDGPGQLTLEGVGEKTREELEEAGETTMFKNVLSYKDKLLPNQGELLAKAGLTRIAATADKEREGFTMEAYKGRTRQIIPGYTIKSKRFKTYGEAVEILDNIKAAIDKMP